MERCRLSVPAPFAFAFLADPSTAPVIDPAVREYRPDHLPMGVGTRNLIRLHMWGIPLRVVSVVRDWEEGHRMVMENVKPRRPVTVTATHSFEPDGDACTYTWAMAFEAHGILGRLLGPHVARFMQENAKAQQVRLRAAVEQRWREDS